MGCDDPMGCGELMGCGDPFESMAAASLWAVASEPMSCDDPWLRRSHGCGGLLRCRGHAAAQADASPHVLHWYRGCPALVLFWNDLWRSLVVSGGLWWSLAVSDGGLWRSLVVSGGIYVPWWSWVVSGGAEVGPSNRNTWRSPEQVLPGGDTEVEDENNRTVLATLF